MPYPSTYVMNTLLERAFREGRTDVSPMKAQKLLFYVHGWHLAITGNPAINEDFEVWQFGPVAPSIYHKLKGYGSHMVSRYIPDAMGKLLVVNREQTEIYNSIDIVWEKYIGIDAVRLSAMTHEPNSPWDLAKAQELRVIPNTYIRDYFVRLAA